MVRARRTPLIGVRAVNRSPAAIKSSLASEHGGLIQHAAMRISLIAMAAVITLASPILVQAEEGVTKSKKIIKGTGSGVTTEGYVIKNQRGDDVIVRGSEGKAGYVGRVPKGKKRDE